MIFLSTLLFSVMITIILISALSRVAVRVQLVDVPDARKLHGRPVPVVGGIAMAIGAIVPVVYWQNWDNFIRAWIIGSLMLVTFGMIDDLRGMSPRTKFVGQIAAALVVILYGGIKITSLGMLLPDDLLVPGWLAIPLTLVAIVGVTNAINLADGLDGLAGESACLFSAPWATWPTWKATLRWFHLSGSGRSHIRFPQVQHLSRHGFHGRHGKPVPRFFGHYTFPVPDPGKYCPEPAGAPAAARHAGDRHFIRFPVPPIQRQVTIRGGPEPFSPPADETGAAPLGIGTGHLHPSGCAYNFCFCVPILFGFVSPGRLSDVFCCRSVYPDAYRRYRMAYGPVRMV